MKTPIVDFLTEYQSSGAVRAHMPGSKGRLEIPCSFDVTEIDGADFLYSANGIIAQSEENAAALFGTAKTLYSTEGSSLCIKAMIGVLRKLGIKRVLSARNAHVSFINACALTGVEPVWLYPEGELSDICSGEFSAESIDKALTETDYKAVYLTSPDYLGKICDISAVSAVCKKHGAMLLVDNAHGAYLKFTSNDLHPITLGADICCDSAHKTLPALTGAAYLHISRNANKALCDMAKKVMQTFGSTSPSYMILASLDALNARPLTEEVRAAEKKVRKLKEKLSDMGLKDISSEPLKITLSAENTEFDGSGLYEHFRKHGIVCEYADRSAVVMMLSEMNTDEDLKRISAAAGKLKISGEKPISQGFTPTMCEKKTSISKAFFSKSVRVSVDDAQSRICADAEFICPPCVPIIVPGEVFDQVTIKILKRYGILSVNVLQ